MKNTHTYHIYLPELAACSENAKFKASEYIRSLEMLHVPCCYFFNHGTDYKKVWVPLIEPAFLLVMLEHNLLFGLRSFKPRLNARVYNVLGRLGFKFRFFPEKDSLVSEYVFMAKTQWELKAIQSVTV